MAIHGIQSENVCCTGYMGAGLSCPSAPLTPNYLYGGGSKPFLSVFPTLNCKGSSLQWDNRGFYPREPKDNPSHACYRYWKKDRMSIQSGMVGSVAPQVCCRDLLGTHKEKELSCLSASSAPNHLHSCGGFKPSRSVLPAPNDIGFCPQGVRLCRTHKGFLFAYVREVDVPGQKLLPVFFSGAAGDPVQESPDVIHLVYVVQLRVLRKRVHHAGNLSSTVSIGKEPI